MHRAKPVRKVRLVHREQPVPMALRVYKVIQARRANKALPVHRVPLVSLVRRAYRAFRV